eukprot:7284146-Ditylum_brightwellii.AAC.1
MCKEDFLKVKDLAIKEDGEVGASLLLSIQPVSSQDNMCKENCPEVKKLVIEEDGEVGASLLLSKKP